ncbi:hypothetical protein DQ238_16200 [Geodermatophilus sp. TF02-6]|uniref:hypothetical protein n=1 Tax=Geodermatophilus sp. TF02-6 TaxID=2250575 RepID=UPI000DEBB96B|nr:hypothetical protein [Geodermatophilus sp. TF02-6]RBY76805.1 hypothetical protein DQ238_16200 [Geodermatophilus sp. TF02-6]
MSTRHLFIDETKHRDYLLVAAVVVPSNLVTTRRMVRELLLPGQRRLHMKDESDPRRRVIASAIADSGVRATVYDAGRRYRTERDRRRACLHRLVADIAGGGNTMLVLEQDDTLLSWDNQCLIEATRATGQHDTLRYEHRRPTAEQLLALPDAIAWCWAKGGDWRRRIVPVVTAVCEV